MLLYTPIDICIAHDIEVNIASSATLEGNYQKYWKTNIVDVQKQSADFLRLIDQLPFNGTPNIYYKMQQSAAVGPHVDVYRDMTFAPGEYQHITDNEPCGYRVVLSGSSNKVSIRVNGRWVVCEAPSVPYCYILHSTKAVHKVDQDDNRRLLYFRGFVDPDKHRQLIDRSLEKYSKFAIYSDS